MDLADNFVEDEFGSFSLADVFVDAIYEGKIVRVPENIAKREGLVILKRQSAQTQLQETKPKDSRRKLKEELAVLDLRRPLKLGENSVIKDLIDNFHWAISKARRERGITRKQLADAINESELSVKLIENGALPHEDFVLVSKIENYFNINLRKDAKNLTIPIEHKKSWVEKFRERKEEKARQQIAYNEMISGKNEVGMVKENTAKEEIKEISGDEIELE